MTKGIKNIFLGIGLGVFLWVLTEEEGLAAIGFLIFCMGLGQVLTLALAVAKPLVSPDGQTVMFFPAVFSSAFYQCLSLCAEKIFQTDGICPVNLCLGVIHRDSSSFFCRVWGRFWSFCSSVRSLNRAAVSTHDLTFQRRCKSSLTALNSP